LQNQTHIPLNANKTATIIEKKRYCGCCVCNKNLQQLRALFTKVHIPLKNAGSTNCKDTKNTWKNSIWRQ